MPIGAELFLKQRSNGFSSPRKGAKADGLGNLGGEYVWYPLISAVENNNVNMVRLLLKYGAKRNVKDTEGATPISIARSNRRRK